MTAVPGNSHLAAGFPGLAQPLPSRRFPTSTGIRVTWRIPNRHLAVRHEPRRTPPHQRASPRLGGPAVPAAAETRSGAWSSAAGSMLWAIHLLRVESLPWVAEREDVLCGAVLPRDSPRVPELCRPPVVLGSLAWTAGGHGAMSKPWLCALYRSCLSSMTASPANRRLQTMDREDSAGGVECGGDVVDGIRTEAIRLDVAPGGHPGLGSSGKCRGLLHTLYRQDALAGKPRLFLCLWRSAGAGSGDRGRSRAPDRHGVAVRMCHRWPWLPVAWGWFRSPPPNIGLLQAGLGNRSRIASDAPRGDWGLHWNCLLSLGVGRRRQTPEGSGCGFDGHNPGCIRVPDGTANRVLV